MVVRRTSVRERYWSTRKLSDALCYQLGAWQFSSVAVRSAMFVGMGEHDPGGGIGARTGPKSGPVLQRITRVQMEGLPHSDEA